jgi:hypothetical protein
VERYLLAGGFRDAIERREISRDELKREQNFTVGVLDWF